MTKRRVLDYFLGYLVAVGVTIAVFVLVFLFSGCVVYSSAHPRPQSHRESCRQAAKMGWCRPDCPRRERAECRHSHATHPAYAPGSRRR